MRSSVTLAHEMGAELIVIRGSGAGRRVALAAAETIIGRDPAAGIHLEDPLCGWRHCAIRAGNGGYRLLDFRTSAGTLVNGRAVREHALAEGDQISIGQVLLQFTAGGATAATSPSGRETLLRASSLLFLVRAFASTDDPEQQDRIETQILRLVDDLTGSAGGYILLGRNEPELQHSAAERGVSDSLVTAVLSEGSAREGDLMGVPLYSHGALEGLLIARMPGAGDASDFADQLASVATLAAAALESAREVQSLETHKALLEEQLERVAPMASGIIGSSPAIRRMLQMVERLAPQDTTVLLLGESGTGKELVARAIHQQSRRRDKPFVAINCAALTETLLESELFGHEKGSFTGAVALKKGKLELAEGGTVFLDEIGELAPGLQAKLLRVLQNREFDRVGGVRTLRLDVRLLAATNRDLGAEVRRGGFREDLYHRLNVVNLSLPPLRERREDIPLLARHFLPLACERSGRKVQGISPEAERMLAAYDWPGNVREVENAIERAVVLGLSEMVEPEDLPESLRSVSTASTGSAFQSSVGDAKREAIIKAWQTSGGDYKEAARQLGIHPNSLLRLIRNLGLRDVLGS